MAQAHTSTELKKDQIRIKLYDIFLYGSIFSVRNIALHIYRSV
jgi:hypothetical protein